MGTTHIRRKADSRFNQASAKKAAAFGSDLFAGEAVPGNPASLIPQVADSLPRRADFNQRFPTVTWAAAKSRTTRSTGPSG